MIERPRPLFLLVLATLLLAACAKEEAAPGPGRGGAAPAIVTTATVAPAAWSDAIQKVSEDGMFFSPWRGLAAHQPLGNVMRSRKAAYEQSARFRAERNGTPVVEPTDLSAFPI